MQRTVDDPTMRIGLFYQNAPSVHAISRVLADLNPSPVDLVAHSRLALTAEDEGLDFLFLADTWAPHGPEATRVGKMDPMVLSPLLAPVFFAATRHLGVVTTVHTSWFHPVVVGRLGANLDALSGGRWGINVVTGAGNAEGLLQSVNEVTDHDERYAMAEEGLTISRSLWRGEECHFDGRYYQAHGRIVGPYAVQRPDPVIFSAGASPAGRRFAARNADWMFIPGRMSAEQAVERIALIRAECEAAGRHPGSVRIMRHVSLIVRETTAESQRVSEWVTSVVDVPAAREYVASISRGITTYRDVYREYEDDEKVFRQIGVSSGAIQIHGDPDSVAEQIRELYDTQECRGIALTFPLQLEEEITRFTRLVLPRLAQMGIWISPQRRGWSW